MSDNLDKVVEIVTAELDLDPGDVGPTSRAEDTEGWDSLGHLRVCMAIESAFGVTIGMETVRELVSVPAIVAFLDAAGQ
jgi:acyl carrier protein